MSNPFEELVQELIPLMRQVIREELDAQKRDKSGVNVEEYFTAEKTAEFLDCTLNHIYVLKSEDRIPYMSKGGRLYFKKSDLINYLESGRSKRKLKSA